MTAVPVNCAHCGRVMLVSADSHMLAAFACLTCVKAEHCVSCGQPTENRDRICNSCVRVA